MFMLVYLCIDAAGRNWHCLRWPSEPFRHMCHAVVVELNEFEEYCTSCSEGTFHLPVWTTSGSCAESWSQPKSLKDMAVVSDYLNPKYNKRPSLLKLSEHVSNAIFDQHRPLDSVVLPTVRYDNKSRSRLCCTW